jgi:hypothetical protein
LGALCKGRGVLTEQQNCKLPKINRLQKQTLNYAVNQPAAAQTKKLQTNKRMFATPFILQTLSL